MLKIAALEDISGVRKAKGAKWGKKAGTYPL